MYEERCEHLAEGAAPKPQSEGCEECLESGQTLIKKKLPTQFDLGQRERILRRNRNRLGGVSQPER